MAVLLVDCFTNIGDMRTVGVLANAPARRIEKVTGPSLQGTTDYHQPLPNPHHGSHS